MNPEPAFSRRHKFAPPLKSVRENWLPLKGALGNLYTKGCQHSAPKEGAACWAILFPSRKRDSGVRVRAL